jgi:hypothetical protein
MTNELSTDNIGPRETKLVVNVDPADLFQNALENVNDYGAFPALYKEVIDRLIEYAESAVEAEDTLVLHNPNWDKRRKDFLLYLQTIWTN